MSKQTKSSQEKELAGSIDLVGECKGAQQRTVALSYQVDETRF